MARIIGAIATSHTPTIGFAKDRRLDNDPIWKPIFDAYGPIRAWLAEKRADVLLTIYNDHVTSFFFDHYSPFALGVDEQYLPADEGGGVRNVPPLPGAPELARFIATSLFAEEFDISFFRGKPVDHGCFSPLSMLADPDGTWPWKILPLQVGVLQFPIPTARRCYRLGGALGRAIRAYPSDLNVAIVATGGLSHQVHGERCGFNNPQWDHQFLDLLETDPEALANLTHAEYAERGGLEGAEIIMWLIMRGALTDRIRRLHRTYYLPSMTAIATAIYENDGEYPPIAPFRDLQLEGVERLAGTYPYTLERSAKAFGLNRFLHDLIIPEYREAFRRNADALMAAHELTAEEADLVRRLDWRGLIHYGVTFFVLEKLAAVVGVSNLHVYAAMRGQSLEEFQATRNAKIEYGVGVRREG
ncbi:MAG: gallate dioxygenase [Steroidobacteraceae bacterium]|jgi:gallate dioxygenase